jgi:hypothetical protein
MNGIKKIIENIVLFVFVASLPAAFVIFNMYHDSSPAYETVIIPENDHHFKVEIDYSPYSEAAIFMKSEESFIKAIDRSLFQGLSVGMNPDDVEDDLKVVGSIEYWGYPSFGDAFLIPLESGRLMFQVDETLPEDRAKINLITDVILEPTSMNLKDIVNQDIISKAPDDWSPESLVIWGIGDSQKQFYHISFNGNFVESVTWGIE